MNTYKLQRTEKANGTRVYQVINNDGEVIAKATSKSRDYSIMTGRDNNVDKRYGRPDLYMKDQDFISYIGHHSGSWVAFPEGLELPVPPPVSRYVLEYTTGSETRTEKYLYAHNEYGARAELAKILKQWYRHSGANAQRIASQAKLVEFFHPQGI